VLMKNENNIVEGQTLTSVDQVAGADFTDDGWSWGEDQGSGFGCFDAACRGQGG